MTDARQPIIVGVGQVTVRDQEWPDIPDPMELMAESTSAAVDDAGRALLGHVDHVSVVNMFSWDYNDAPSFFVEKMGLRGRIDRAYLGAGGNSTQRAVNELASRLASGEIEVALVSGAEAVAGKRIARRSGHWLDWGSYPDKFPSPTERDPNHPIEAEQQASLPIITYPMWEPALRTAAGRTPSEHRAFIGRLMSRFTEVAADNPYAWFPKRRSAQELMTVTPENRMIGSPYPKRVNSIIEVSQGASLFLTTVGKAQELGIPEERWVYILGGGDCDDIWYLTERTTYAHSPGMRKVAEQAWASTGLNIDDVGHLDLYSCFPSAVQLAMDAFGISAEEPRPMTVTGGLPYAGGPGNNYTTHSIAAMTDKLRANPGDVGLCTGLGWHVTKHSAGLYSSAPPTKSYAPVDSMPYQSEIDAVAHPVIETQPRGAATIEAYSVSYTRDGSPETARCLARLDERRRSFVSSSDSVAASKLAEGEWCGREVELTPDCRFAV